MNKLFITNKNGSRHWFVGGGQCSFCNLFLEPPTIGFVIRLWRREGNHEDLIVCPACTHKIPSESVFAPVQERLSVIFCDSIPPGARPVFPLRPNLMSGELSVFDAVNHRAAPSEKVTDNTRFAGRPDSTFLGRGDEPVLLGRVDDDIKMIDNEVVDIENITKRGGVE